MPFKMTGRWAWMTLRSSADNDPRSAKVPPVERMHRPSDSQRGITPILL